MLENLKDVKDKDVELEQYSTPPIVAAELLHFAYMRGDIEDKVVYDLGSGNGILAIGAKLLGARKAVGIEKDKELVGVAVRNSEDMGVDVEFRCCDVEEVDDEADTVVMNPPFGAQFRNRHADRVFLKKALEIAKVVYSLHRAGSEGFIKKFIETRKARITHKIPVLFPIKHTFRFHKKERKDIEVEIFRIEVSL
ncbi:MAG: METTL5 family protein [Candidatus Methanospirareceae archaeon]